MLSIKSENGTVDILELEGTAKRIIADLGASAHKTMLFMANQDSRSMEEVYIKYGLLARQLVDYIEDTVQKIDETT